MSHFSHCAPPDEATPQGARSYLDHRLSAGLAPGMATSTSFTSTRPDGYTHSGLSTPPLLPLRRSSYTTTASSNTSARLSLQQAALDDLLHEIQQKLEVAIIRPNGEVPEGSFIPRPVTRGILSYDQLMRLAMLSPPWESRPIDELAKLMDRNVFTVAMLIRSGCTYDDFSLHCLILDRIPNMDDYLLGMSQSQFTQHFGIYGSRVFENRSILLPAVFQEGQSNDMGDLTWQRAPFVPGNTFHGTHATVHEIHIAPGGWEKDGIANDVDKSIAMKVYKGMDLEEMREEWEQEDRFFQRAILQSPVHHDHVIQCLGSLKMKDKFALLFELADMDLAKYLLSERTPKPNFFELAEFAARLASGLGSFHYGYETRGTILHLLHRDVKPQNILVVGNRWKLSDFGRSIIDKSAGAQPGGERVGGAYRPPEPGYSSAGEVFSLGAILLEVIAFAEGGPEGVRKFRVQKRGLLPHDKFWEIDCNTGSIQINSNVLTWIKDFTNRKERVEHGDEMASLLDFLVRKVLVVDPRLRVDAKKLAEELYNVQDRCKPFMKAVRSIKSFGCQVSQLCSSATRSSSSFLLRMPGAWPRTGRDSRVSTMDIVSSQHEPAQEDTPLWAPITARFKDLKKMFGF